jgi:hypothetical protein
MSGFGGDMGPATSAQLNLNYAQDHGFERWSTRLMLAVVEKVTSIFAASSPS